MTRKEKEKLDIGMTNLVAFFKSLKLSKSEKEFVRAKIKKMAIESGLEIEREINLGPFAELQDCPFCNKIYD